MTSRKNGERPLIQTRSVPLIVVEGIDGTGKTTVSAQLAARIGAVHIATPLVVIDEVRAPLEQVFKRELASATVFWAACNMASSEAAERILASGRPVVLTRYWASTRVYAEVMGEAMPLSDVASRLLPADITVWLKARMETRAQRIGERGSCCAADDATLRYGTSEALGDAFERVLHESPVTGRRIDIQTDSRPVSEIVEAIVREVAG